MTDAAQHMGCILLKFYIKPQQSQVQGHITRCCILLKFFSNQQHLHADAVCRFGCILLKFYIKPQRVVRDL